MLASKEVPFTTVGLELFNRASTSCWCFRAASSLDEALAVIGRFLGMAHHHSTPRANMHTSKASTLGPDGVS